MQAVLLAAGLSSRLYPFNNGIHKSMLSVLGKPFLLHTIEKLKNIGITEIIIVTDTRNTIKDYFSDGKSFGVSLTYVVQENPAGMGDALLKAKDLIRQDFLLLHGYHVDINQFATKLINKKTKENKAVLLAQARKDSWKYGVLKVEGGKVIDVVEKPKKGEEPSKLCVVGIYLLSQDFLQTLSNTPFEHYQFEKALSIFSKKHNVSFIETKEKTIVLKYPWDLLLVKDYFLSDIKNSISKNAKIAKSAEITGSVIIEDGATIMEGVIIKGPCYIGKNTYIGTNVILRGGVDVEKECVIGANMEVKNSLIMEGSTTHSGFIGDSIIGKQCKIAAEFVTANVRLDRKLVKVKIKEKEIDSGHKYLGAIIGSKVSVGIRVSTMPGVIVGNNVTIGPSTVVKANIADNTTYYTKFKEIVEKNE